MILKQDSTEIQTLIFPKDKFESASAARAWAKRNGFSSGKLDETGTSFRFRQKDPDKFKSGSFRTIALPNSGGVKAVIGRPKIKKDCGFPGFSSDAWEMIFKIWGNDAVETELFKASKYIGGDKKKGLKKFMQGLDGDTPGQKENKETFDGTSYGNIAPGERTLITEDKKPGVNKGSEHHTHIDADGRLLGPDIPGSADSGVFMHWHMDADGIPSSEDTDTPGHTHHTAKGRSGAELELPDRFVKGEDGKQQKVATAGWGGELPIRKRDVKKRIVICEVYVPFDDKDDTTIDTHGHACLKEDIEAAAYGFLRDLNNHNVDLQHNFVSGYGYVVESYLAKAGDPMFKEGTWVIGIKVTDDIVWDKIEKGEITGVSLAGSANLVEPDTVLGKGL